MATASNHAFALASQIEVLRRVLRVLDPDSLLWLAVAVQMGELLRLRIALNDVRFLMLAEPTSVIDCIF